MASKAYLITVLVATIFASQAFATDYVVGDEAGWKLGVNYTAWAEGKEFYVGDRLVFKYAKGAHNVNKVNGTDFQRCNIPPPSESLTTGNDIITLATPGRKWYVCGIGKHCVSGMKLVISVSSNAPAPAPMVQHYQKKPTSFWSHSKLKIHFFIG